MASHREAHGLSEACASLQARCENVNILAATVLVDELARANLAHAVICPGSRSAPLAIAFSRSSVPHSLCVDERGAAFLAVGYARASGRPAAVVVSSGTAVANLLPAAVEAAHERVPLLLLTADRPAELRDTAANQTISQPGLLSGGLVGGGGLVWSKDVPCPEDGARLEPLLADAAYAISRTTAPGDAGPVHLNLQWREPLSPQVVPYDPTPLQSPRIRWWASTSAPFTTYMRPSSTSAHAANVSAIAGELLAILRSNGPRCALVAGSLCSDEERSAVVALARHLEWPLFGDVRSGVRHASVALFEPLLRLEKVPEALQPDLVLQLGDRLVSKRLQALAASASVHIVVAAHADRSDPSHSVTHRVQAHIAPLCEALLVAPPPHAEACRGATSRLMSASGMIAHLLDQATVDVLPFGEIRVARALCAALTAPSAPPDALLFASNSSPIRHLDSYCDRTPRVLANRGASGIDGILHTSLGAALAHTEQGTNDRLAALLIGDLAFLHDISALETAARLGKRAPLVIVVLNNGGGGIFHMLPVARFGDVFSPYFDTPHGHTFRRVCENFGLHYALATTDEGFQAELQAALSLRRPCVIEVTTRKEDVVDVPARCIQPRVTTAMTTAGLHTASALWERGVAYAE